MRFSCPKAALLAVALCLSGCVILREDIRPDQPLALQKDQAIVLVGIDSDIPLGNVLQGCEKPCVDSVYGLIRRKDIVAFAVDVGKPFKLSKIQTTEHRPRSADLRGEQMEIDRHGVYYYGSIKGNEYSVGLGRAVNPYYLLAAKRKFGSRFDQLETVNFAWPPPSDDQRIRFGYPISTSTQTALTSLAPKRMHLATVTPASPAFDANCRGTGGSVSFPEFLPQEEYIRRAFNAELEAARWFDEAAGSIALKGAVTELVFRTQLGAAYWKIGLRLEAPNGRAVTVNVKEPFKYAFSDSWACANAEDAFPGAVQKLIEAAINAPEFQAF